MTLENLLGGREEVHCPECMKVLVVTPVSATQSRFDGCGNDCLPKYDIPDGCITFGVAGGIMTIWRLKPKVAEEPQPPAHFRFKGRGW